MSSRTGITIRDEGHILRGMEILHVALAAVIRPNAAAFV
jgi:hypothetical protein